jgi:hypothetical protein
MSETPNFMAFTEKWVIIYVTYIYPKQIKAHLKILLAMISNTNFYQISSII